jgi:LPS export ABC transporter protein LptC
MITRVVIVLAIIGIILGALFLGQGGPAPAVATATGGSTEVPGYSARNAEVTQTGDDGRAEFVVVSPLIRQHANDERVQLEAPRLKFISAENGTWNAQALSGLIQADGSTVQLHGDVKINGALSDTPLTIATSTLAFDTRSEIATTPAHVRVDARGGTLTSMGLIANLKESTLQLESNPHLESPVNASSSSK